MNPLWLELPGLLIWCSILLLPWRPWSTREELDANSSLSCDLSKVTVLIPARNEEDFINDTLASLKLQGNQLKIILVDDQSTDKTAEIANRLKLENLLVLNGESLPTGWSGKLWALEQGRKMVETENILLLDADIKLKPGTIASLLDKMERGEFQLVSLMAFLRMVSLWEKLLMPAFIFFFKLLYPFHISNSSSRLVAAAAGGCILINTQILNDIGGFEALKDELIDDCSLARMVKNKGYRTWTGLTHSAISQRNYNDLGTIWEMVTRTAYTQLRHSIVLLFLCTLLMIFAFILPVTNLFFLNPIIITFSIVTLFLMGLSYLPTLKYYDMNPLWTITMPIIGLLYLLMTWGSAINHWRGTGSLWKERTYNKHMN